MVNLRGLASIVSELKRERRNLGCPNASLRMIRVGLGWLSPDSGVSNQKIDEIKVALRELGLSEDVSLD